MIRKSLFAILTGLVGAVLLHIVIILSLPAFTGLDAYTRLLSYDAVNRFVLFANRKDSAGFSNGDPYLRVAACIFSVEDKPVRLTASGSVPFWSFAVYDSSSNEVFSMNDRPAGGGDLDAIIASPQQLAAIRKADPNVVSESVLVEMPRPDGYIVLRALAPEQSFEDAAGNFLAEAGCDPYDGQ
jgi:uncharacterized membrane protein